MNDKKEQKPDSPTPSPTSNERMLNDPEAMTNLVGFFDLALKVHMRIHPELYGNVTTQGHD